MYFGYPITNEGIEQLVQEIVDHPDKHKIVIAEDDNLDIAGTIHIASMNKTQVEFGIMVAESYRGKKVANKLMEFAIAWVQNRGLNDIYMHCLMYNAPIIHIVKKYGLEISKDNGDADAHVTLPRSNIFTIGYESIMRQQSAFKHNILQFKRMLEV